jgi:hypothetical protein
MADFMTFHEPLNVMEEPNESSSEKNSLFRGALIEVETNKPELSASFYMEKNPLNRLLLPPTKPSDFLSTNL